MCTLATAFFLRVQVHLIGTNAGKNRIYIRQIGFQLNFSVLVVRLHVKWVG